MWKKKKKKLIKWTIFQLHLINHPPTNLVYCFPFCHMNPAPHIQPKCHHERLDVSLNWWWSIQGYMGWGANDHFNGEYMNSTVDRYFAFTSFFRVLWIGISLSPTFLGFYLRRTHLLNLTRLTLLCVQVVTILPYMRRQSMWPRYPEENKID